MNGADRLWSLGAGVLAAGIAVGAWFGVISPDLRTTSTARDDLAMVEQQNAIHEARLEALEQSASLMDEYLATRDELAQGIPSELAYSDFLRQLDAFAVEAGVTIDAVASIDAVPYAPPVADESTAPVVEDAATGEEASAGEVGGAAPPPADSGAAPSAPVPYSDPLVTEQNLAAVQVTVSASGEAAQLRDFLERMQLGTRLISITGASITTETDAESGKAEIVGYLYVLQPGASAP
ncbi:hypothetical protein [Agrococcus lahaulensis]|uniref:hypothetical protein n=1 Tax=Agrococcus lahaulensis TaxID=341722 RepID=UPI00047EC1FD|nr:hypothetical protein [Agrococcus lahaulensis]